MTRAIQITACLDCPLVAFGEGDDLFCQHPDSPDTTIDSCDGETPTWCPLRAEPLWLEHVRGGSDKIDELQDALAHLRHRLETTFDLASFQRRQAEWARRNFGEPESRDWRDPLMGIAEEYGELNHALLKQRQGIRGTHDEHETAAKDAVGDMLVYLADLCTLRGWKIADVLAETWAEVSGRNWTEHKGDGVTS